MSFSSVRRISSDTLTPYTPRPRLEVVKQGILQVDLGAVHVVDIVNDVQKYTSKKIPTGAQCGTYMAV